MGPPEEVTTAMSQPRRRDLHSLRVFLSKPRSQLRGPSNAPSRGKSPYRALLCIGAQKILKEQPAVRVLCELKRVLGQMEKLRQGGGVSTAVPQQARAKRGPVEPQGKKAKGGSPGSQGKNPRAWPPCAQNTGFPGWRVRS